MQQEFGQNFEPRIRFSIDILRGPCFGFHQFEKVGEVFFVEINVRTTPFFKNVFVRQLVKQLPNDVSAFQLIEQSQVLSPEQIEIVLNNAVTKRVERINLHLMRFGSDERRESFAIA